MVQIFEAESSRNLSRMGDFLSTPDFEAVKHAAHTIKGGGRQMDAHAVTSICEEVEDAAREQSASKIENGLARLRAALSDVYAEMAEYSARIGIAG